MYLTDEHEDCPFDDCCYSPTNYRCPVVRRALEEQGLPVPEVEPLTDEATEPRRGRPKKAHATPTYYQGRQDYQRRYQHQYRRVTLKGIRLRRRDIEVLRTVSKGDGKTLEEEVTALLEYLADVAREKSRGSES